MAAFLPAPSLPPVARRRARHLATCLKRREVVRRAASLAALVALPVRAEEAALPPGATAFTRVLGARTQWENIGASVAGGKGEWGNVRGFLRRVYSVSADMEFMMKVWKGPVKERGGVLVKNFRKAVKALDKPAEKNDIEAFMEGHRAVQGMLDEFFALLKEASVGDIPEDL